MDHNDKCLCQVKARKLAWLIGIVVFIWLINLGQYFELPFGSLITSTWYAGNISSNTRIFHDLQSTATETHLNFGNTNKPSKGEDIGSESNFVPEKKGGSDDSIELGADKGPKDESPSVDFADLSGNSTGVISAVDKSLAPEKARESAYSFLAPNYAATDSNTWIWSTSEEETRTTSAAPAICSVALPPIFLLPNSKSTYNKDANSLSPIISVYPNTSLVDKDIGNIITKDEKSKDVKVPKTNIAAVQKGSKSKPSKGVVSISAMNNLLLQSRASSTSKKPQWSSAVDQDLQNAKTQIANAPSVVNDPRLHAPLYRNVSMFKRSYELMEQTLKVYIYKEGERPIFHQPVLRGVYSSEGWFMKLIEEKNHFVTEDTTKAHLFYLPFSSKMLRVALYTPESHSKRNMVEHLKNYIDMIAARYSFWNRTAGADHFLVACHDWAPYETMHHMGNCLRALCNSNIKEGFTFGKDVSLPTTSVKSPKHTLLQLGGKPPSHRHILAFFAGSMHGYLRPILLEHWQNKDPDMQIFGPMRNKVDGKEDYVEHMKSSKYCICPRGYGVNSPRVVEAIFHECVPVIIADNYVPPFFEILNWESFAVFVPEKDIPNLKSILLSIPEEKYLEMQNRVKKVQQHFLWHPSPVKYDIFHMILHSMWYNRVFQVT